MLVLCSIPKPFCFHCCRKRLVFNFYCVQLALYAEVLLFFS